MDREFKIVISIFLFFLIYGLSSMYGSGAFVTPIFLNQIILLVVGVIFYVMNQKTDQSWLLLLYLPVLLVSCAIDVFAMGLLSKLSGSEWFINFQESDMMSWLYVVIFFGFMFFVSWFGFNKHKRLPILLLNLLLLASTLVFMFIPDLQVDPSIPFFVFILLLYFTANRLLKTDSKVLSVISSHLMLVFFLELLEYFH